MSGTNDEELQRIGTRLPGGEKRTPRYQDGRIHAFSDADDDDARDSAEGGSGVTDPVQHVVEDKQDNSGAGSKMSKETDIGGAGGMPRASRKTDWVKCKRQKLGPSDDVCVQDVHGNEFFYIFPLMDSYDGDDSKRLALAKYVRETNYHETKAGQRGLFARDP